MTDCMNMDGPSLDQAAASRRKDFPRCHLPPHEAELESIQALSAESLSFLCHGSSRSLFFQSFGLLVSAQSSRSARSDAADSCLTLCRLQFPLFPGFLHARLDALCSLLPQGQWFRGPGALRPAREMARKHFDLFDKSLAARSLSALIRPSTHEMNSDFLVV